MSLQPATTSEVLARAPRGSLRVRLEERLTRDWFEVWHSVAEGEPDPQWRLLERGRRHAVVREGRFQGAGAVLLPGEGAVGGVAVAASPGA